MQQVAASNSTIHTRVMKQNILGQNGSRYTDILTTDNFLCFKSLTGLTTCWKVYMWPKAFCLRPGCNNILF